MKTRAPRSTVLLIFLMPWGALAQDPGLLGENGKIGRGERLDPGDESALLDKRRIAEESYRYLQGLRESGNPHIRKGLLLSNIRDDPGRQQVDLDQLRQKAILRIERRELPADPPPGPEAASSAREEKAPSGEPSPRPRPLKAVLLGITGIFLISCTIYVCRRRKKLKAGG
jgi:hypothetical protein